VSNGPDIQVWPGGPDLDKFPDGDPEVGIKHRGCELRLRFAKSEPFGEGELLEVRVLPDEEPTLKPKALRQFAPDADQYLAAARAAMKFKVDDIQAGVEVLRGLGGPGRALTHDFYRGIAREYAALLAGGEKHPVKALGEKHHATISAASRWLKEARRRGLVDA
jgi:hypothetical protein